MGLPPVVVEISASDASAELRSTLVQACSRAVQDGECVESEGPTPESAAAVAIVSWQPDGTIRIEVGLRSDQPWHTRILRFEPNEEPEEVFTAVGFAIGALVGRLQQEEREETAEPPAAPEPAPPEPPPRPVPPPPPAAIAPVPPPRAPKPAARTSSWIASAAVLGGSGRAWSNWRVGATAALAWVHPTGVSLGASGTYAVSPAPLGSLQVNWAGFGVGPGYELGVGRWLSLAFVGELGMEHHYAEITLPESRLHGHASRWVGIGRLGAALVFPARSPVAATFGVGATAPFGVTEVRIAGASQRSPAPARTTALLGIRYDARYGRW